MGCARRREKEVVFPGLEELAEVEKIKENGNSCREAAGKGRVKVDSRHAPLAFS